MPMKVEAAIVTQKRPEAAFNTDSVNVNGKVFPREVIKNGYKGSGVISGSAYFALTSSAVDGFADAAVAAFNERAEVFSVVRDVRTVFSGFYEDCRSALLNMGREEKDLTCACFYASGRKVALAGSGDVKLYLHRLNNCTPVSTERVVDTVAEYSAGIFSDVTVGDIFILLSPGTAEALSEKEIEDICRISDGSVKRIVNYITKVGLAKDGETAVSAIVVKILDTAAEDGVVPAGFVPDFSDIEKKNEKAEDGNSENAETENAVEDNNEAAVSVNEPEKNETEGEAASSEREDDSVAQESEKAADEKEENTEETFAVSFAEAIAEAAVEEAVAENTEENSVTELTEEEIKAKAEKRTRIVLFSILGVLIAISLVLIAVIVSKSGFFAGGNEETTVEETTTAEETTEEETTEEETTEEETTEEETTEEEAATAEEETTRRAQQTVTPVTPAVTTTAAPAPTETTSAAPEETTSAQSEETTAAQAEETSAAPEADTSTEADVGAETETQTPESTSAEAPSSETAEAPDVSDTPESPSPEAAEQSEEAEAAE